MTVVVDKLLPIPISGRSKESDMLAAMFSEAKAYLLSFPWSKEISRSYLGAGVGGVVAAFLFEFDLPIGSKDSQIWVVVGDVPSAYFVVDHAPDGASALDTYCDLMEDWSNGVLEQSSLDDVFPVEALATSENAKMLKSRVEFIRERIIPSLRGEA